MVESHIHNYTHINVQHNYLIFIVGFKTIAFQKCIKTEGSLLLSIE